ncbi:MAG: hypothetical protein ACYSR1_01765 [Planctomycetota bacterium]
MADKEIAVPEMETLILQNIQITENDLKALVKKREQAVENYILSSGKMKHKRLFLVNPSSLSPKMEKNIINSRVDLTIFR